MQDGQRAVDATTSEAIVALLGGWNMQLTERMLAQMERHRFELKREQLAGVDSRRRLAKADYALVSRQFDTARTELFRCRRELQRLHDECVLLDDEKGLLYGQQLLIEQKERERGQLTASYEQLRERNAKARLAYRDLLAEVRQERRELLIKASNKKHAHEPTTTTTTAASNR